MILGISIGVIISAAIFFIIGLCQATQKPMPTIPANRFLEPHDLEDGQ